MVLKKKVECMFKKIKISMFSLVLMSGVLSASSFSSVSDLENTEFVAGRNALKAHVSSGMDFTRDIDGTQMSGSFTIGRFPFCVNVSMTNGELITQLRQLGSLSNVQIGEEITDEQIAAVKVTRNLAWKARFNS